MTIKSLTITEDAYESLKRYKHGDESFSEVILRMTEKRIEHVKKYFGALKKSGPDAEEWIRAIKKRRQEVTREAEKKTKYLKSILEQHGNP